MKRYNFTLTELLVTIGIIIILAGLAIPAVLVAQQKGRVTAAKADMNAILTALKGVEGTYHKMVNTSLPMTAIFISPKQLIPRVTSLSVWAIKEKPTPSKRTIILFWS